MTRLLRERGATIVDSVLADDKRATCKAVRRHIRDGARLLAVCGGDGTLTAAVQHFAGRHCALLAVPAGTGNSFALGLGIESFEHAAEALASGRERRIDLGCVNGTYFANFVMAGVSADIARRTSRRLKRIAGPIAYGIAGIEPIFTHRPFAARLRWTGGDVTLDTHQVIVAVGRYFGHMPLAADARLADGNLTVFVRDAQSTLDLIGTYLALLSGEQRHLSGARLWSTPSAVRLAAKPKARVSVDGSSCGKTPVKIEVVPRALRVLVPPGAPA